MQTLKVLYVCLGNIIRSPAARAVLQALVKQDTSFQSVFRINVDSCATGNWHIGSSPDERMFRACQKKGIFLDGIARQIQKDDFEKSTHLFVADQSVLHDVRAISPPHCLDKIHMMTAYSERFFNQDVPDPYYEEAPAFDYSLEIILDGCIGFIKACKQQEKGKISR